MTEEQIKLLRLAIQREVEYASIDGMEHGAWGWAEKDADVSWKCFQESFKPVEIDGINKQSKTLTDIVYRWWDDAFTFHIDWDKETCVEDLIDQVEQWLPKRTDVCEEYSYETGRNHVIDVIKRNLR